MSWKFGQFRESTDGAHTHRPGGGSGGLIPAVIAAAVLLGSGAVPTAVSALEVVLIITGSVIGLAVLGGIAWLADRARQHRAGRPIAARPVYQLPAEARPPLKGTPLKGTPAAGHRISPRGAPAPETSHPTSWPTSCGTTPRANDHRQGAFRPYAACGAQRSIRPLVHLTSHGRGQATSASDG